MSQTPPPVIQYAHARPGRTLFLSPTKRGNVAIVFIALTVLTGLLVAGSAVMQRDLLMRAKNGAKITKAEASSNDMRHGAIGLLNSGAAIGAAISFLMWVHRVYRNLGAFPDATQTWTPGWVVGYFFIPIMNLFRPYQSMKEVWDGSKPWAAKQQLDLVSWWWGTYILTIVANVCVSIALTAGARDQLERALAQTNVEIMGGVLSLLPFVFVVMMIRKINELQAAKTMEGGRAEAPVAGLYQPPTV